MDPTIPDLNTKKINRLFQVDIGFDGEKWFAMCLYIPQREGKILTSTNLKSLMREVSKQVRIRNNEAHRFQLEKDEKPNGRIIIPSC